MLRNVSKHDLPVPKSPPRAVARDPHLQPHGGGGQPAGLDPGSRGRGTICLWALVDTGVPLLLRRASTMVPPVEEPVSPEQRVFPLHEARSAGYKDTENWCHVVIDAILRHPPRSFPLVGLCYI